MTFAELVRETVEYIQENGRSTDPNDQSTCMYLSPDGNMCAVGRCLTEEGLEIASAHEGASFVALRRDHFGEDWQQYFREPYRGFTSVEWSDLQSLHDDYDHWSADRQLTDMGRGYIVRALGVEL